MPESLCEATLASSKDFNERTKDILEQMEAGALALQSMNGHVDSRALDRIASIVRTLQSLHAAKGQVSRAVAGGYGAEPFSKKRQGHLSELTIERYRGLSGLQLLELRRINIMAGSNNSGKTSVLEAVYLLSQQHDVDALFEVMRRRARLEELPPRWTYEYTPAGTRIKGRFDGMGAHLHITCERDESQLEDSSFYIGSITMGAVYGSQHQRSRTDLFSEGRNRATSRQGQHVLCKAVLSSPFSQHDPTVLAWLYERSVEAKTKEQLLEFLRRAVDEGLENIELSNEFKRFLVTHRSHERALDLSSFGEGMQRIFHVGLLISWAQDGLVLIDEFENAIHASLLVDFTGFLQRLAREFNTQIFLSTHSKECIDAFVYNGESLGDVGYYSLKREPEGSRCEHVRAEELQSLLEAADVDIRRLR
jgi:hypothetical protein